MQEDAGAAQGYVSTKLFGGAMEADMPVGFGDVSNLRPVPSHQEIYLSTTGFTSIDIDITERVSNPAATAASAALPITAVPAAEAAAAQKVAAAAEAAADREALIFHFEDIVSPGDESRVWEIEEHDLLERGHGCFTAVTPILHLKATTTAPSSPPTTTVILLTLIRLIASSTDLIMTVNIPLHPAALSAFTSSHSPPLASTDITPASDSAHGEPPATEHAVDDGDRMDLTDENANADADANGGFASRLFGQGTVQAALVHQGEMIAQRVFESLRIRDWGLFEGEEEG